MGSGLRPDKLIKIIDYTIEHYLCTMNKKVILIILDGWGIAADPRVSAIDQARTPFISTLR